MSIFCEDCGKNIATVFLVKVAGGEISRLQLCEECSKKMEEATESARLIALVPQIISGMQSAVEGNLQEEIFSGEPIVCGECGTSFNDFKKLGYLGCSVCYKVFGDALENTIFEFQGSNRHTGKTPTKLSREARLRLRIAELERNLRERIAEEEYEAAAAVRDRIRKIESILNSEGSESEKE